MRLPKSQFGLTFSLLYILGSVYLIVTQGLFGESFVVSMLGLPWSYLFIWSIIHKAISLYIVVLGSMILNTVFLYWIGVGVQKLFPTKYKLVGILLTGFLFGSVVLSTLVSFGIKGMPLFESLAPLAAPGMSISKHFTMTKASSNTRLIINPGNDAVKSIQDLMQQKQGRPASSFAWVVMSLINGVVYSFLFWLIYLLSGRFTSTQLI